MLDLHSCCMQFMLRNGLEIPGDSSERYRLSADKIFKFVGLVEQPKPHNGLVDAKYEFESFCRLIYGKNVCPSSRSTPCRIYC